MRKSWLSLDLLSSFWLPSSSGSPASTKVNIITKCKSPTDVASIWISFRTWLSCACFPCPLLPKLSCQGGCAYSLDSYFQILYLKLLLSSDFLRVSLKGKVLSRQPANHMCFETPALGRLRGFQPSLTDHPQANERNVFLFSLHLLN